MKPNSFQFNFELQFESAPSPQPEKFIWLENKKSDQPQGPMRFWSDAHLALYYFLLNENPEKLSQSQQLIENTDPHHILWLDSCARIESLHKLKKSNLQAPVHFEQKVEEFISEVFSKATVSNKDLVQFAEIIEELELKRDRPFLFDFSLTLSPNTIRQLRWFYGFLFSQRALCATIHNQTISDPAFEALKMDSITDYIYKPEYILKDALLFHEFKKLTQNFSNEFKPMKKLFFTHSSSAALLVENLPNDFLNSLPQEKKEEVLHLAQIDWLMGSATGILFKIREELYGLSDGFEKIFWKDLLEAPLHRHNPFQSSLLISKDLLLKNSAA